MFLVWVLICFDSIDFFCFRFFELLLICVLLIERNEFFDFCFIVCIWFLRNVLKVLVLSLGCICVGIYSNWFGFVLLLLLVGVIDGMVIKDMLEKGRRLGLCVLDIFIDMCCSVWRLLSFCVMLLVLLMLVRGNLELLVWILWREGVGDNGDRGDWMLLCELFCFVGMWDGIVWVFWRGLLLGLVLFGVVMVFVWFEVVCISCSLLLVGLFGLGVLFNCLLEFLDVIKLSGWLFLVLEFLLLLYMVLIVLVMWWFGFEMDSWLVWFWWLVKLLLILWSLEVCWIVWGDC